MSLILRTLEQRPMPRAANPYYASSGVIGPHLTDMLTSRRADVATLTLFNSLDSHGRLNDQPEGTRSKLRLVRGDVWDSHREEVRSTRTPRDGIRASCDLLQVPVS